MSRISTGIGLVSGLDIEDIVTKLMQFERRPIDLLETRIANINIQKTVFAELTGLLLQLQVPADQLHGTDNIFESRSATSSNESVLTATVGKGAPLGNYSFTVKSLVQSHQLVSRGFAGVDSTLGAGTMTIELGAGNVDPDTALDGLNGGAGVPTGEIVITDRSGRTATVDLTGAVTVRDVLDAINATPALGVVASVEDNHIVLGDTTGATDYDLSVEEASGGTVAAALGILDSVSSDTLTGSSIAYITADTYLDGLNDGRGVRSVYALDDIRIARRDGVTLDVNISSAQTVGDIMDLINNHANNADGLLTASISADGTRLELVDTTGGGTDLSVTALNGSQAGADLGLLSSVSADTLTGDRIAAGLNTVLLASLNGGSGVAAGSIAITDRSGASDVVDLSSAETLSDVIVLINASSVDVTAALNSSRTGLLITDTSGGSGTLDIAEAGSTTAGELGILGSASGSELVGSNVQFQYISENTRLDTLNGGDGVFAGKFRITDRSGLAATVDLSQEDDIRIEDVISEINSRGIGVTASVNSNGDGILITDTSGGIGDLKIVDLDGGTTAEDLNIAGTASEATPDAIDGSFEYRITIEADDTLQDIATNIENSGAPVSASIINDGSASNPYRLGLVSNREGTVGEMVVDTGGLDFGFLTTQAARDAVVLYGQATPGSSPIVVTSTTNSVTGLIEGLTLNLKGVSDGPVSIAVGADDDAVVDTVSGFVDSWNSAVDQIKGAMSFNPDTEERGVLLGDSTALRVEDILNRMMSYTAPGGAPGLNRMSGIGVSFLETGKVAFDPTELREALASNRSDVEELFTTVETGLGAYFSSVLESITDEYDGVLKRKSDMLDDKLEVLQSQVESIEARLAKVQVRLYREFYAMEEALSLLETQRTAVENLQNYMTNLASTNKNK